MIDWARVLELRDEVGAAEFEPVLEMFADEVEEVLIRLSSEDPAGLESDLHFLKGCACNLGFSAFATLCQSAEALASRQLHHEIDIAQLIGGYATSKQIFRRDLARIIGDGQAGVA
jgi:HPt (histidine-containing phosphotransfer) domain-containing protein